MHASRPWWLLIGVISVLSCVLLGIAVKPSSTHRAPGADTSWMALIRLHQSPFAGAVSTFLGEIGGGMLGGIVIPLLIMVCFVAGRRPRTALFFGVATVVSAESVVLLKLAFDRPSPGQLVLGDLVGSFPSGHAANAATLVVVLCLVARRAWVVTVGGFYVVLMMISRTYLGVHWLSDTFGGVATGVGAALILYGLLGSFIDRERNRLPRVPRSVGTENALSG